MDQGLVELCGECVAALPTEEEGIGSRLELLRHTVTTQLSLLQQTAGLPPYSRAAVEVCVYVRVFLAYFNITLLCGIKCRSVSV